MNLTGRLIAVAVASMIAFQTFVNVGVAKDCSEYGTSLPFISYGLSSLLANMVGIGLVLNVGLQRNREVTLMNIGFIAHDTKKKLMQNFCIAYRGILSKMNCLQLVQQEG